MQPLIIKETSYRQSRQMLQTLIAFSVFVPAGLAKGNRSRDNP